MNAGRTSRLQPGTVTGTVAGVFAGAASAYYLLVVWGPEPPADRAAAALVSMLMILATVEILVGAWATATRLRILASASAMGMLLTAVLIPSVMSFLFAPAAFAAAIAALKITFAAAEADGSAWNLLTLGAFSGVGTVVAITVLTYL